MYFDIDIRIFRMAHKRIPFDVFIKISEGKFTKVFNIADGVDFQRLAQYITKGVKELYILESDRSKLREFLLKVPNSIVSDPKASQEERVSALMAMTEQNMFEILSTPALAPETAGASVQVVRHLVKTMTDDLQSIALLLQGLGKSHYLLKHSISVAVYSVLLAKAADLTSASILEVIACGALLHDIGKSKLPEVWDEKYIQDPNLLQQYRQHTYLGLKMVEHNKLIPEEAKHIIFEHHERPDGQGYPNKINTSQIYPLAKIVRVADGFVKLTSPPPAPEGQQTPTPLSSQEAIKVMLADQGGYDNSSLRRLDQMLNRAS